MGEKITIDLSNSENAKKFGDAEIIHRTELKRTKFYIDRLILSSKEKPDEEYLHQAITILGSRGSGKTSFLLSLVKSFENRPEITVLPIIDPTLIEEKGHAFLNVVSAISDIVNKKFIENKLNSNCNSDNKRIWHEKLMRLAGGIPSIDGIGQHNGDHWMDPEFVMETGLATVSASRNLQIHFNDFLKESAKILETNVFLLRFDDIDVDSTKGWAVLECIRKYFTSPKLIIILSGDINLYSIVVRQKKWTNFGKEILNYEKGAKYNDGESLYSNNKFNDLVVDLSSQYMLKIMPPKYRIHLTTISEKKKIYGNLDIYVKKYDNHKEEQIEDFYNNIIRGFGIVNPTQQESYRTFLLSLPLRSQIQFLTNSNNGEYIFFDDNYFEKEVYNNEILDIFISELEEKNVDTYIIKYSSKFINSIILKLLLSTRRLHDVYQLQPITTDNSLNGALFSLNILLSSAISNQQTGKYLIFDYFLKVAYPRNLLNILPYSNFSINKENNPRPSIESFCENCGIFTDRVLRDMTGEMQSYIFGLVNSQNTQNTNYYIKLSGLQQKAKQPYQDRLDTVFSAKNGNALIHKILGYIPGFISTHAKQRTQLSYSIYMLFATIGELLKRDELVTSRKDIEEKAIELKSALLNLSQLRVYNAYNFDNTNNQQDKNLQDGENVFDSTDEIKEYPQNNDLNDFVKILLKWFPSQNTNALRPIPSHILGKIFTRFFYALQNIDRNYMKDILLGELINYQIISFFNAVIIEDTLEQLRNEPQLNMDNTNLSNKVFLNNLDKLNNQRLNTSSLTLSRWLLSCPLLLCYINNNDFELKQALSKFIGEELNVIMEFSVYNQLNDVEILNSTIKNNQQKEYPILWDADPSLLRKGKEKELVEMLKDTYPRTWFENNNVGINRLHNEYITKYLFPIFGEENNAGAIRKFRKYLSENPSVW